MRKYGADWWRMVAYWRLHRFWRFMMGPVAQLLYWVDYEVIVPLGGTNALSQKYDTWSIGVGVEVHGRWATLCYGKAATPKRGAE